MATTKSAVDSKTGVALDLAEAEPPAQSEGFLTSLFSRKRRVEPDAIATTRSVFDDPALADYYLPHPQYENLHRFDPEFRWTHREETSVRRKCDFKIFLWILVMFFGLNLDRGNLGNASADNLLPDLGINTNDYKNAQNMYRVGFLISGIPSQMVGKRLAPDRWIPVQIICWSLASGGQFIHNRAGFFACRFFLGFFMGGFIPDSILYLSYFYTKTEMPFRLALFYLDIGVFSFLFLVPGPTQTKTWWNKKGYFNEREENIIVNRVLRDDPSKGDMHNRQALSLGMLWRSLKDYDLWPIYAIGMLFEIPTAPPKSYLSLPLKAIGYSMFETTLLSIPVTVFAAINLLLITAIMERFNQIALIGILTQLWSLPLLIVLYTSADSLSNWGLYAVTFVLFGWPSVHAAHVGWCSRLSNSLSGIASSNIYREDDKPYYYRGNGQLIAINVATIAAYVLAKAYYVARNRWKRAQWEGMSELQKVKYLETTTDQGNKRLDFLFDS
ncbi:putative MFS transporter [Aspergillus crustosus]